MFYSISFSDDGAEFTAVHTSSAFDTFILINGKRILDFAVNTANRAFLCTQAAASAFIRLNLILQQCFT